MSTDNIGSDVFSRVLVKFAHLSRDWHIRYGYRTGHRNRHGADRRLPRKPGRRHHQARIADAQTAIPFLVQHEMAAVAFMRWRDAQYAASSCGSELGFGDARLIRGRGAQHPTRRDFVKKAAREIGGNDTAHHVSADIGWQMRSRTVNVGVTLSFDAMQPRRIGHQLFWIRRLNPDPDLRQNGRRRP